MVFWLTAQRVFDEGWETALIIEGDVDWDLDIKSQMQLLASTTRALANARHDPSTQITDNNPTTNPYGHEWDMLWIGACANPPGPPNSELCPGENGSHAHWVYYPHGGLCCNWAYAVTRASAKSLLVWLQDLDEPTDFAMSRWCGLNDCIVVWPELFGSFTPPGGRRRGSDNDPNRAEEKEDLEKGSTRNIVNSATVDLFEKLGHKGLWSGP